MNNFMKKLSSTSLACGWLLLTAGSSAWAVDISDKPLVGEYDPVPPNVMFMIDDSGSMRGEDQFYTPGYDFFGEDYTCDGDLDPSARNATIINSSAGTVNARIWRDTDTAYFNIGGTNYVVADEPGTYTIQEAATRYECSSNSTRTLNCRNDRFTAPNSCTSWENWTNPNRGDYGFEYNGYTCFNDIHSVDIPDSAGITLTAADCKAELDGNASSAVTSCVFDAQNNYPIWNTSGSDRWVKPRNLTFSSTAIPEVTATQVCFDPEQTYTVQLEANSCSGDYCYSTRSTDTYDGGFLNWYFSASSNTYYDTYDGGNYEPDGDIVVDLSGPDTNFNEGTGYKQNTNDNKKRMDVAKDVAHILAKGIDNMRVGIASFQSSSSGGEINQELVELDDPETEVAADASYGNRQDIHDAIDTLTDENWTPLGETWATLMDYFSYGINDSTDLWVEPTPERANTTTAESGAYTLYGRTCTGGSCVANNGVRVGYNGTWRRSQILEGLPSTPSEEPITADWWCRNNFIIGLTDGEPTEDKNIRQALYRNESTYYGYFNGDRDYASDSQNGSDALDDVAVFMYEQDMRPDIPRDDSVGRHRVVTYLIAFGTLTESRTRIMESAATYSGGKFYNAKSGADVAAAMVEILGDLGGNDYADAPTIISGGATELGGSLAFEPNYNNGDWTGTLEIFKINQATGNFVDAAGNDVDDSANAYRQYEISAELAADFSGALHTNRRVFTLDNAGAPIAFTTANKASFATSIAQDIAAFPDTAFPGRTEDGLIEYLRGETALDGTSTNSSGLYDYRDRGGNILGSLVHSSPIYVQSPPRPWPDTVDFGKGDYSTFQDDLQDRLPMVYVGANDGMLHAFRATDPTETGTPYTNHGEELFAYIPTFVGSSSDGEGLHYYAEHDYDHYYFVDLTPTLSDVYMDIDYVKSGGTLDPEWHTILIGGAGKGGKGVFALNVTCPIPDVNGVSELTGLATADAVTPDRCSTTAGDLGLETYLTAGTDYDPSQLVMWEFDSADDVHLGYTYSRPTVAKINYDRGLATEPNGNGTGSIWAAIFGNGYNSSAGYSSLYILFLDGGLDGTWTLGTDYIRIDAETVGANGLSSPELIDIDGDLVIDYAYAGDLQGNVWRFTFDETASSSNYGTTMTVDKIFQAKDAAGNNQPITTAVKVRRNPDVKAADPNLIVMFGTGKALGASDLTDVSVQSIYGVHDRGQTASDNVLRANLAARTLTDVTYGTDELRNISGTDVAYGTEYGWRIDLNSGTPEGERVIFDPVVIGGTMLVSSSIYDSVLDCDGISDGWLYALDWREGKSQVETENEAPFDANGDGVINANDLIDSNDPGTDVDYTAGKKTDNAGAISLGEGGKAYLNDGTTTAVDTNPLSLTKAIRLSWEERFPSY